MDSENEKSATTEIIANGNASAALETNELIDEENDDDLPPLEDIEGTGDKKEEEIEKQEVFDENGYFDILDNKQLLKKTLKEGSSDGQRPQRGNRVTINLKTRLKGDEKLIESQSVEGLQLIVGDYDTIHGVDLVVPLMHKGEIAQVLIA
ncbi:peptidyl-prolyl cis-trans isomerase FKBP8-like protein, partial [Leptotrombidium deliense]